MLTTHIERADLNLLAPLVALLEERQVSRAASRVGLSQPAMSRALQRLRRPLDDPLLVRDPDGFRLSARAEDIHRQLTTLIPLLETLLSPAEFDPRAATQPVNIAGSDYAVHTYGPAIARLIGSQSPDTAVRFHSWRPDGIADQIRRGAVDLGLFGGHAPDDLNVTRLVTEHFKCVVSEGHPLATRSALTLADYLGFGHVVVDVADGKQPDIDYRLAELGRPRRAATRCRSPPNKKPPRTEVRGGQGPGRTRPRRTTGHSPKWKGGKPRRRGDNLGIVAARYKVC